MTRALIVISFTSFTLLGLVSCRAEPAATATTATTTAPAAATAAPATTAAPAPGTITGPVAETMNSGGYTYALVKAAPKDVWIAATEQPLKVGERITAAIDMPMENFNSKTLNRSFPLIYFVSGVTREGEAMPAAGAGAPALAASHGSAPASAVAQVVEPIAPAPGGVTIAQVWAQRKTLSGKVVVVRGKVVKVNNEIMGSNWFHIQDGSGTAKDGTNDLTITTNATVNVGDIVTISGTLATDKDFGAGYAYDVIVEKATVTQGKAAND
jgi:hypothetical protein